MLGRGVYDAAMFATHAQLLSNQYDVIRVQALNVQNARSGAPLSADEKLILRISYARSMCNHSTSFHSLHTV